MARFSKIFFLITFLFALLNCKSSISIKGKNKPYAYGRAPESYALVVENFEKYSRYFGAKMSETIASIGAGNGSQEVQISCMIDGINWYLEEIDSTRLYQFNQVLAYHQKLKVAPILGEFHLVLGEETATLLPIGIFDRVIMSNVFHEISEREPLMMEIKELLNEGGELVIMERMGKEPNQTHKDCKHPKLFEPDFLREMSSYGYTPVGQEIGEEMSALTFYTFKVPKD